MAVVSLFTYLFVLMPDDVNYAYFVARFIYEHQTIILCFSIYLWLIQLF